MNTRQRIITALARLAARRQAEVEMVVLELYAEDLESERFDIADIEAVCDYIGKSPRAEFQTAFPAVGDLIASCRQRVGNRVRAHMEAEEKRLREWVPSPIERERGLIWLRRAEFVARKRGTPEEAAERFPLPALPESVDASRDV